jgi:predicted metalloprotease with PDZ domain
MFKAIPISVCVTTTPYRQLAIVAALLTSALPAFGTNMKLDVDASQAPRRILHSHVKIPVSSTKVVLYYPKWSPGDHAPLGRVTEITDLVIRANGKTVAWRRNLTDAFRFEVDVPAGTTSIDADFDIRLPAPGHPLGGASARLIRLRWDSALLYDASTPVQNIPVDATLTLPPGWSLATSLPISSRRDVSTRFKTSNLSELVDSPVLAGRYMRTLDLTPGSAVGHSMAVAADVEGDLPAQAPLPNFTQLIAETTAMFRSEHYRNYQFLVAASDFTGPGSGFEHGESSDNGVRASFFHSNSVGSAISDLLPHEYAHSWSGKYRRPVDLTLPDYQQPAKTDLLWVYEGVTAHVGYVLTSRSGFWTPAEARDYWASIAARVAAISGRTWRNLQDTVDSVPVTMPATFGDYDWNSWVRGLDYYEEGALLWLEVGAIINQETHGRSTLDDFLAAFYGGPSGLAAVKTYTAKDVVETLGRIAPYDWKGFFNTRLTSLTATAPLDGFERSGWRLVYDTTPNSFVNSAVGMYTIGIQASQNGTIVDVAQESAAFTAGIVPAMKIVKVNGKDWNAKDFKQSLEAARPGDQLALTTTYAGVIQEFLIPAGSGLRYPHLQRISSRPDLLTPYLAPHTKLAVTAPD